MDHHIINRSKHTADMRLLSGCNTAGIGHAACMQCGNCNKRSEMSRIKEMQQLKREKEKSEVK
jgi:hypothetical protein